jgi:hypothetical protein
MGYKKDYSTNSGTSKPEFEWKKIKNYADFRTSFTISRHQNYAP